MSKRSAPSARRGRSAFTLIELPAVSIRKRRAFTLIELFVVIAIIAVLVALLMPAIQGAVTQAKKARANADVKSLVLAWKNYYNEYGRWPVAQNRLFFGVPGALQDASESGSTGLVTIANVMTNIMYPDSSRWGETPTWGGYKNMHPICTNYNPKRVTFMTYHTGAVNQNGDMVDPWGNPYKFLFDADQNGRVNRRPFGTLVGATSVYDSVISWSMGPDGRESDDDVNSWD